jgi:hypothetical protein
MRAKSGLRHGSTSASLRPSPKMVSPRSGDDPRVNRCQEADVDPVTRDRCGRRAFEASEVSPFVLLLNDSESFDGDPPRTSLALSDRLAGDQQDRLVHARWRLLRILPSTAWPPCRAASRSQRGLVGPGDQCLARRSRSPTASSPGIRHARRDPHDAQARLSGHRAPQSRSDVQRTALAQSRCLIAALPHGPRRARASSPTPVERLPQTGARRPFFRALQLSGIETSSAGGVLGLRAFEYLSTGAAALPAQHRAGEPTTLPRTRSG